MWKTVLSGISTRAVIRGDRAAYTVDSMNFNNDIIYDHRGDGNYGLFRFKDKIIFKSFKLTNSTAYNFMNSIVNCEKQTDETQASNVLVENCTFYGMSINKASGIDLFNFKAITNTTSKVTILNSIFGKTMKDDPSYVSGGFYFLDGKRELSYSLMAPDFVVDTFTYDEVTWDQNLYNDVADPLFEDPENGNFNLMTGSPARNMSSEGRPIGDPRWAVAYSAVKPIYDLNAMKVYPNPASTNLNIELKNPANITIYNVLGVSVYKAKVNKTINTINVSGYAPGLYFIRLNDEPGVRKVIIR